MAHAPSPVTPGYLWVLSEPGKLVGLDEYHSWYDNIHVAMRMTAIPEFLTGSRWECTDGKAPRFTANYDIASVALFSHDKYTGLRANRPPLEADIVKRLETLDRRTCATVQQSSPPPPSFEQTPGYMATVAGKKASFDGEQIDALKGVKGWKRSHRHEVYDSLNTGNGHEPWANIAPEMVTIHEFDDESYVDSDAWKAVTEGKDEVRRWKLYRAWPNTAPKDA